MCEGTVKYLSSYVAFIPEFLCPVFLRLQPSDETESAVDQVWIWGSNIALTSGLLQSSAQLMVVKMGPVSEVAP